MSEATGDTVMITNKRPTKNRKKEHEYLGRTEWRAMNGGTC